MQSQQIWEQIRFQKSLHVTFILVSLSNKGFVLAETVLQKVFLKK